MMTTSTKQLIERPFYQLMINNKERLCSFLKKKNGKWVSEMSGMSGGLHFDQPASGQRTGLVADKPRKLPTLFFFSRALLFEHLEQAGKLPDPLFFGKNEMSCMCSYLGHSLFLFCLFLSSYRYRRTLSLSLP